MNVTRVERIRAVVTRAKQNIQDFQLGLQSFYDSKPHEVIAKEDAHTGERLYRLVKVDPVPFALTTIAADVIQNLRSPLDHLAFQLVLDANGGRRPTGKDVVYYPITSAASEYKALRARNIMGVRQEVIDAIDATEPYPGGKGHALWQLNQLNKIPKHQDLLSTATVEDGVDFVALIRSVDNDPWLERFEALPPFFIRAADTPPLNVGDVLARVPREAQMTRERHFSFAVTFHTLGVIEREPALKFLQDTANLVDDIVSTIGPLLA